MFGDKFSKEAERKKFVLNRIRKDVESDLLVHIQTTEQRIVLNHEQTDLLVAKWLGRSPSLRGLL